MINNIQEMKQRLEEIKLQASSWMSSTDGSYEACLNAMGYYTLQNNIYAITPTLEASNYVVVIPSSFIRWVKCQP